METTTNEEELHQLFEFLKINNRDDVKKLASQGLSQLSSNNNNNLNNNNNNNNNTNHILNNYLINNPNSITILIDLLSIKEYKTLGDILTIFINISTNSIISNILSKNKLVQKAMRLLDIFENYEDNNNNNINNNININLINNNININNDLIFAFKEMTLMFLNNITASSVIGIQDLIQIDDEDLEGYYISRLFTIYSRQPENIIINNLINNNNNINININEDENEDIMRRNNNNINNNNNNNNKNQKRQLKKWFLQICLNITRTPHGQLSLLKDEDWPRELFNIINNYNNNINYLNNNNNNTVLRYLASQTLRNCATTPENHHYIINKCNLNNNNNNNNNLNNSENNNNNNNNLNIISIIIKLLHNNLEPSKEIQLLFVEFIAAMLMSCEGMTILEEISAKKILEDIINNYNNNINLINNNNNKLVNSEDNDNNNINNKLNNNNNKNNIIICDEAVTFIKLHVLPHLDDIQDAYITN